MKKLNRIFRIIISIIIVLVVTLGLGTIFSHTKRRYYPENEKVSINEIIEKDTLSDSDYEILYKETGLTKIGIDRLRNEGLNSLILDIQNDYYNDYEIKHNYGGLFLCSDEYEKGINHVILEDGDILISSSTHFSFFNVGHAGLVIDASNGTMLEISGYFTKSNIESASSFFYRDNFIVLRVKCDTETKNNVINYAKNNLVGIDYSIFRGIANKKNPKKLNSTQCAHIVWYAYKKYGIDLDINKKGLVTVKDLINLDLVEVVQVYGFNPDNIWK